MTGLFGGGGGGSRTAAPTTGTPVAPTPTTPYPADGVVRAPVLGSPVSNAAGNLRRQQIMARSGRASTRLAGNPGTAAYGNSSLGSPG